MKKKLIISACLLGEPCRYDGRSVPAVDVGALSEKYELIPVCPEVMGGLPTPRVPSERIGGKVINKIGIDVTENYNKGAAEALRLAKEGGAELALLKEKSPSCGKGRIYDGSFSGTLIPGDGVTVELLTNEGIRVLGESEIEKLLQNS